MKMCSNQGDVREFESSQSRKFDMDAARQLAKRVRIDVLEMIHSSHASHIGSAFSCVEIVVALYSGVANVDPRNPLLSGRDRIVLSKGHAGVALYATLAECGYFPREELAAYYQDGGRLSGHISHKNVPGVELSTGSLGHGVCVAAGMALAEKISRTNSRVYAIVGDGECEEGSVWEMALFAAHHNLDNFTVVVDHNRMQAMGFCEQEIGLSDLESKWRAFGWNVISVPDGNDIAQVFSALTRRDQGRPTVIVAYTVKGKGVSFMENELLWHYRDPQDKCYEMARRELMEELA